MWCRILPGVTQVLSGDVALRRVLRDVQVEDLPSVREQVELDPPASYIESATVLVTRGGWFDGSELVRRSRCSRSRQGGPVRSR